MHGPLVPPDKENQGQAMSSLILLRALVGLTRTLDIACSSCARSGRISVARLVREHGLDTPVCDTWANVNHDCPKRDAHGIYDRCRVHCPTLAALFTPVRHHPQ